MLGILEQDQFKSLGEGSKGEGQRMPVCEQEKEKTIKNMMTDGGEKVSATEIPSVQDTTDRKQVLGWTSA